ncbi:MAG: PfkB family carbohydrate kinase [Xenococcaceae cyanobacterium]
MKGLFVGLITLDVIYLCDRYPEKNEKIVASEQQIAAGGPATNAAITFSSLQNQASLLTILGERPSAQLIRDDLNNYSIDLIDLDRDKSFSVPISSIIVNKHTGERAVVSINATKAQTSFDSIPSNILEEIDIVLIDGHLMEIGAAIAPLAKAKNIPTAIDGGSWKPGWENVLPYIDYAVCSADFYPPHCRDRSDVFAYLLAQNIDHIAISNGAKPIQYFTQEKQGQIEVSQVEAIDTLGAGDVFHGSFCHYILQHNFPKALEEASKIATRSCQFFGTRSFL